MPTEIENPLVYLDVILVAIHGTSLVGVDIFQKHLAVYNLVGVSKHVATSQSTEPGTGGVSVVAGVMAWLHGLTNGIISSWVLWILHNKMPFAVNRSRFIHTSLYRNVSVRSFGNR